MAIKNAPPFTFTVNTLESRVTPSVGAGRETMTGSGANAVSPAHTFEGRFTQEIGTH